MNRFAIASPTVDTTKHAIIVDRVVATEEVVATGMETLVAMATELATTVGDTLDTEIPSTKRLI